MVASNSYPAASGDDGHRVSDDARATYSLTTNISDIYMGRSKVTVPASDTLYDLFVRFAIPAGEIPAGCTIDDAHITFNAHATNANITCKVLIKAVDTDDPAAIAAGDDALWSTPTAATVAWASVPAWTAGDDYDTPDLAAIIQELVNSYGARGGKHIEIMIWENGSSAALLRVRRPHAFDSGVAGDYPELTVNYTEAVTQIPQRMKVGVGF